MTVFVADVNMFRPEFLPDINGKVLNISESASVGTLLMELKVCPEQIHKKQVVQISGCCHMMHKCYLRTT